MTKGWLHLGTEFGILLSEVMGKSDQDIALSVYF